jgi:hypothetical protein
MSTELVPTEPKTPTEQPNKAPIAVSAEGVDFKSLGEMFRFCSLVHESRLAPKQFDSPQAILVAIQHGLEIGLKPMQALQSIAVINGRPCIWGDGALALVVSKPDFEDIEETFNAEGTEAKCVIKRKGQTPTVRTFSIADAKLAGLWEKAGPWKQYPKRMLQMRARSFAMRDAFPDALKGTSIREEQQDVPIKQASARVVEEGAVVFPDDPKPEPRDTLALEGG